MAANVIQALLLETSSILGNGGGTIHFSFKITNTQSPTVQLMSELIRNVEVVGLLKYLSKTSLHRVCHWLMEPKTSFSSLCKSSFEIQKAISDQGFSLSLKISLRLGSVRLPPPVSRLKAEATFPAPPHPPILSLNTLLFHSDTPGGPWYYLQHLFLFLQTILWSS